MKKKESPYNLSNLWQLGDGGGSGSKPPHEGVHENSIYRTKKQCYADVSTYGGID